ncbi:MAG: aminotransferase class IV [Clostridia bacterium]|nr:aminotransferase class IV [Clostridia bacterium]
MKTLGFYNGRFDELENMTIPMTDRVCWFGDGCFDTTYSRNYIIHNIDEHVDRFFRSAGLIDLKIPYSQEEFKELLRTLVRHMDTDENFVYFQATRGGYGPRSHTYDPAVPPNIWVVFNPRTVRPIDTKFRLITMPDTRALTCHIKSLNLLPAVLGMQAAQIAGCDEVIFHRDGRVTECAHSNVNIIRNNTLITAPTDNLILSGIARRNLLNKCHELGYAVSETPFTVDDLFTADEVVISSSGSFALQAVEIDGRPVGGKAYDMLHDIQQSLLKDYLRETDI